MSQILKILLFLLMFLAVLVAFLWFPHPTEKTPPSPLNTSLQKKKTDDVSNNSTCVTENTINTELEKSWNKTWDGNDLLSEGFTADDITLILHKYKNPNFALQWRRDLYRQKSYQHTNDQSILQLRQSAILDAGYDYISTNINYPRKALENYANLPQTERQQLLMQHSPTVEDIAAFISAETLSEKELIELVQYVEEPNRIIGGEPKAYNLMNLLDYSVAYSHNQLFDELLKLGVTPTNDRYLPNTLEWAILPLAGIKFRQKETGKIQEEDRTRLKQISKTIQKLSSYNLGLDIQKNTQGVKLLVYGYPVDLNHDDINQLYNEFDIDLLGIKQKDVLTVKELSPEALKFMKEKKRVFEHNSDKTTEHCKNVEANTLK